jgi:hypothetical protein
MKEEQQTSVRAMNAADAGAFYAGCIGLPEAIPAQRMWRLARVGLIPCVRLGRRVLFQSTVLEQIAANGGVTFHSSGGAV